MKKRKYTILIIEDNTDILETTHDFLVEEGFDAIMANDGLSGIQKAVDERPDLIISDISMPGFDGYKVYEILQENVSTSTIPFIFLSAKAEKEDIRAGMQLGADDYLTKPFDYDELLASIRVRLKKHEKYINTSEDKFNKLLNNPHFGIFILQDKFIVAHNTILTEAFEIMPDNKRADITQLIDSNDAEKFEDKLRKCYKGIISDLNYQTKTKSGTLIEIYGSKSQIEGKPVVIGTVKIVEENGKGTDGNDPVTDLTDAVKLIIENQDAFSKPILDEIQKLIGIPLNVDKPQIPNIKLSKRELEVLSEICKGYTNHEIAENLYISRRTVDTHRSNLLSKTNSKNTAELIVFAIKNKLINP